MAGAIDERSGVHGVVERGGSLSHLWTGRIALDISKKTMSRIRDTIRKQTRRTFLSLDELISELNVYIRGAREYWLCRARHSPFVRLVGHIDENSAADVSTVLGSLRAIQRDHEVAVLLVHHARKSPAAHPNQAYRGSSDFAAWSDSNLFLTRNANRLVLSIEHRSAPSPEPVHLRLEQEPAPHLVPFDVKAVAATPPEADPLLGELRQELERVAGPLSTAELRDRLRRRKSDVITALEKLRAAGVVRRTANGWQPARD